MKRGPTGAYDVKTAGGESVRAFVPKSLPPAPAVDLGGAMQRLLERAQVAVGRLDSVSTLLPEPSLFLYSYIRKEAVLSSQIEGTQSSLSELLLFEMDEAPGAPIDDVGEVSNYVAALEHGLSRLREQFPLSGRLIREIHAKLLAKGRGSEKSPGEYRRTQNWIGGSRPGNALYVPPPPSRVDECMGELEKFLHADDGLPVLVRAALAHVQFESVHPFLDGNGRVGRLLITFLLCHAGLLREPLLYLSLYLKQNRAEYYRLLDVVRHDGDWEAWLTFFLEGVVSTAEGAVVTAKRLVDLFAEDHRRIADLGRRAGSALRVHEAMKARPVQRIQDLAARTDLTFPTVASALAVLADPTLGIAREITGKLRNRVFVYDQFLAILEEGTETP